MDSINKPVNSKGVKSKAIGGRIVAEREKKGLSQIDLRLRTGVSKSTQIKYEAGTSYPDAGYLVLLDTIGLDVMYILTNSRSYEAMTDAHQNLIEAYEDAPDSLKRAAFAVLLSPYVPEYEKAQNIPGYHRFELKGEEDARFVEHSKKESENSEATKNE